MEYNKKINDKIARLEQEIIEYNRLLAFTPKYDTIKREKYELLINNREQAITELKEVKNENKQLSKNRI